MTIINPNSISGITSVTAEAGVMNFYKSEGTLAGLQLNGVNFNTTSGISTFNNVYVGGTITYEDVKNVDSVGIVTARAGLNVTANIDTDTLNVSGISTFGGNVLLGDDDELKFGAGNDGYIKSDGTNFLFQGSSTTYVRGSTLILSANGGSGGYNGAVTIDVSGSERVQLKYGSGTKLVTTNTGVTVTGTVAATSYTGDGSALTGVASTEFVHAQTHAVAGVSTFVGDTTWDSSAGADYDMQWTSSNGQLRIKDSGKLVFGSSGDATIKHDDSNFTLWNTKGNSYFQNTGDVYIRTNNTETSIKAIANGAVELYHDTNKKLETTSAGTLIQGDIVVTDAVYLSNTSTISSRLTLNSENASSWQGTRELVAFDLIGNGADHRTGTLSIKIKKLPGDSSLAEMMRLDGVNNLTTFYTNAAERLRIDSVGKVYIGNQDNAASSAYFNKETSGDYKFNIHSSTSTVANRAITFNVRSNVEAMRIDADRQVLCCSDESFASTALVANSNASMFVRADSGAWALKLLCRHSQNDYAYLGFASQDNSENLGEIYVQRTGNDTGKMVFGVRNSGTNISALRIKSSGELRIGADSTTASTAGDDLVIEGNSDRGLSIISGSASSANIYFGDSSDADVGRIAYQHNDNALDFSINAVGTVVRIDTFTDSTHSTTSGVLGINDTSPSGEALALCVKSKQHQDSNLPVVHIERMNNHGGGAGNDEIALNVTVPNTHNNANDVYTIKSYAKHNLNATHFAGHFEARGSQYDAGGDGAAVYATTHKTDTNGGGYVPCFYAYGRSTYNIASNGYAVGMRIKLNGHQQNTGIIIHHELTNSNWTPMITFRKGTSGSNGTEVGSIKSSNNATQYNTSSDYRLKENVVDLTGAITRLKQLKPKRFNFKNDTSKTVDGFIAHEVEPVVPQAVSGTKDAMKIETVANPETGKTIMNEDGTPKIETVIDAQEVDYSKLSTLTIAALQEALAKIETLEAKVAALEGS